MIEAVRHNFADVTTPFSKVKAAMLLRYIVLYWLGFFGLVPVFYSVTLI